MNAWKHLQLHTEKQSQQVTIHLHVYDIAGLKDKQLEAWDLRTTASVQHSQYGGFY